MDPNEWPLLPDPKSRPHARVEWVQPLRTTVWNRTVQNDTHEAPEDAADLTEPPKMDLLPDEAANVEDIAVVKRDPAAEKLAKLPKMDRLPDEAGDVHIADLSEGIADLQEDTAIVTKHIADLQAISESEDNKGKGLLLYEECGLSKLECGFSCYNKTILGPLRDMEKRIALHSTCTWSQIFRILVPLWKIEYLTGNGGWISVTDACKDLHCNIHILDDCQLEPTVIVSSKHNPDSARQIINAFLWFHKLITSHGQFGEASSSTCQSMTRLLARRHHITDFTIIAEECQTIVLVKEDERLSSLPDDYIIEIHGKLEDVNRTVELVMVHLSQFPFDDCIASLLYRVPKQVYKSISSNVVTRYVMIPDKHRIPVQALVDGVNIEGGIFATLQQVNSNTFVCELIGGSNEVAHALRLVLQVLEERVFQ